MSFTRTVKVPSDGQAFPLTLTGSWVYEHWRHETSVKAKDGAICGGKRTPSRTGVGAGRTVYLLKLGEGRETGTTVGVDHNLCMPAAAGEVGKARAGAKARE